MRGWMLQTATRPPPQQKQEEEEEKEEQEQEEQEEEEEKEEEEEQRKKQNHHRGEEKNAVAHMPLPALEPTGPKGVTYSKWPHRQQVILRNTSPPAKGTKIEA